MPRYLVTNGSNFQPFTYDELARPLQEMATAHNAAQDQYDTLSTDTAALKRYISDNPGDKQAKELYDNYVDRLNSLQENLWNNGYTAATRRDLSQARTGYASDISRLGVAIKNRQARSAEYWKTKHDHPDMIMGDDPGTSGLDNYLNDDMYGTNWYHYSGNQFMSEVGADAKARANELVRDPRIMNDPRLAGYITRITQDGFTSVEVANASAAVKAMLNGDASLMQNLDPASSILADVLTSHLESTGAAGKVSPEEFNRLFDYGRAGLSQAIGKTDIKDMNDKVWDFNKSIALQNHSHALAMQRQRAASGNGGEGGGENSQRRAYSMQEISTFVKNKRASEATGTINKHFIKPFEKPVTLKNGTVLSTPEEAEAVINSLGRDKIVSKFGVDPIDQKKVNAVGKYNGKDIKIQHNEYGSTGAPNKLEWVVLEKNNDGKWIPNNKLSEEYASDMKEFNKNLNNWRKENSDIKLENLIISQSDWDKIRKKNNIPDYVANEDIPYVLATQAGIGNISPAEIAPPSRDMDTTRENYARYMIEAYNRADHQNKKLGKTSERLFYPISNGSVSQAGVGADKVFGKNADKELSSVSGYPEDIIKNRVRVMVNGKEYLVNPAMLGNNMDAQVSKLIEPVKELMTPITNPSSALHMSEQEAARWLYLADGILGDYFPIAEMGITPDDVVRNPQYQSELRTAVNKFISSTISDARDMMMQENYQVRGNTSANAVGYNEYYNE